MKKPSRYEEANRCQPLLPLPPPVIPPHLKSERLRPKSSIISRPGWGTEGHPIKLTANHFKVSVQHINEVFYQYNVAISSEENKLIQNKDIGRKILDKLYQIYSSELDEKKFAYDGEKTLYTVGPLPQNYLEFMVVLEESISKRGSPFCEGSPPELSKRSRRSLQSKTFKVVITYAAKIPLKSIPLALKGAEPDKVQDALRVLDIILRQQAAIRGCLLVRQSFFHDDSRNFVDVGGGVTGCRGLHSSFRPTHGGLSLNMDVPTTMILTPGPVIDFLCSNQNVQDPDRIDWIKAKRMLKNMRVKARHNNMEFKIMGLSENSCSQQFFPMKVKGNDEGQMPEITVYDFFTKHRHIELTYSKHLPCLNVGKPKRPSYLPLELCSLVSLQRYTRTLSSRQRGTLVEKSQKPMERKQVLTDAVRNHRYDDDPLLAACGIKIEKNLTHVDGRVLEAPKVGDNEECVPCNGRWNLNNKRFFDPITINDWAIINFSARCNTSYLSRELINCAKGKGIKIQPPYKIIEEDEASRREDPIKRVNRMFDQIKASLPGRPEFLLCILPERRTCAIYGPWKRKCLCEFGFATQCIAPTKITDLYLSNVLLKINSKLGGTNSLLAIEHYSSIPLIKDTPTLIIGMDVSHGSPGRADPSIAAVVGSRSWPLISRYRAAVRTQSPKVEMIESLFKPLENGEDDGIIRELLEDFSKTSNCKPAHIIIFRDGVSETQFNQVLNNELDQIIRLPCLECEPVLSYLPVAFMKVACQRLPDYDVPKFTVIVAQKNHHTTLFRQHGVDNVPPGTVVDTNVVHPRNYDFYMCSHAGIIGTSRPAHYHVLLDEIGFSPDDLQNLIHHLSYVYQRSTTAVSIVAPICYAHLAAQQMGQLLKCGDRSGKGSKTSEEWSGHIPQLPRLNHKVAGSMFFC